MEMLREKEKSKCHRNLTLWVGPPFAMIIYRYQVVGEISKLHVCQQFDKVVFGKEAKNFFL